MANLAVEFHDSSVEGVRWIGGDALLEMSVFVLRSEGRPGWDDGDGWFQDAEVVLYQATTSMFWAWGWVLSQRAVLSRPSPQPTIMVRAAARLPPIREV